MRYYTKFCFSTKYVVKIFSKLFGFPDILSYGLMALGLIPAVIATIWTAGRAWHVERRLAQHQDIDVPVFKLFHYFKNI